MDDGGDDASADAQEEGIQATTTPDNGGCAITTSHARGDAAILIALFALVVLKRRRVFIAAAAMTLAPITARAETPPPVDDEPHETEPPMRRFAVYVNPLSLIVDRYGGSIEVLLASHHAIEASAYYVYSATNSDTHNVFTGVGGELGYRFYLGRNGFRGFYVGPSFLISSLQATPLVGNSISYANLGGAIDAGFQALVADRVLVGVGAGAQYTAPTASLPQQQVPASVYANAGIRPRVSISFGVAF